MTQPIKTQGVEVFHFNYTMTDLSNSITYTAAVGKEPALSLLVSSL